MELKDIMSFITGNELSIPLLEVIIFIVINSLCLLFGRYRLGLLISYCFVFYWGFIFNMKYFIDLLGQTTWGVFTYATAGLLMFITAIVAFFFHARD